MTRYLAAFLTAHRHVALEPGEEQIEHDHGPARPMLFGNGGLVRLGSCCASDFWMCSASGFGQRASSRVGNRWCSAMIALIWRSRAGRRTTAWSVAARDPEYRRARADLLHCWRRKDRPQALCLVPAGVEPLHDVELSDRKFTLTAVASQSAVPLALSSTTSHRSAGRVDRRRSRTNHFVAADSNRPADEQTDRIRNRGGRIAGPVDRDWDSRLMVRVKSTGDAVGKLQFDVRSTTRTDTATSRSAAQRGRLPG